METNLINSYVLLSAKMWRILILFLFFFLSFFMLGNDWVLIGKNGRISRLSQIWGFFEVRRYHKICLVPFRHAVLIPSVQTNIYVSKRIKGTYCCRIVLHLSDANICSGCSEFRPCLVHRISFYCFVLYQPKKNN